MPATNSTPTKSTTITCPACGAPDLPLVPHPTKPGRLVARHACLGQVERDVYETDAPPAYAPGSAGTVDKDLSSNWSKKPD